MRARTISRCLVERTDMNRTHREEFEDWFLNTMPADRKSWLFGAWLAGAKFERDKMHNLIDAELEGMECSNSLRDHVSDTVRDREIAVEASLATNVFEAQAVVNKLKAAATKEVERFTTHNVRHERQLEASEACWKMSARWKGWASFRHPCEIHSAPRERR